MKQFNMRTIRFYAIRTYRLYAGTVAKILVILAVVALIVYGVIFLSLVGGADYTTYPDDVAKVWICEEPYFEIRFGDGNPEAYLEIDGQVKPVDFAMARPEVRIFELEPEGSAQKLWEDFLLVCDWELEGNTLVLTILEDNLFDGKYTKLVFVAQD